MPEQRPHLKLVSLDGGLEQWELLEPEDITKRLDAFEQRPKSRAPRREVDLRARDLGLATVAQEVEVAAAIHRQDGDFDKADELLDNHLPYGSSAYFRQLVKNGRARAAAATTYGQLERVEDFHDELHDFLGWHRRYGSRTPHEENRTWLGYVAEDVRVLNDSDLFWRIASALCRIEGINPSLDYITQFKSHDAITTGVALQAACRAAIERGQQLPERAILLAQKAIELMPPGIVVSRQLYAVIHDSSQPKRAHLSVVGTS